MTSMHSGFLRRAAQRQRQHQRARGDRSRRREEDHGRRLHAVHELEGLANSRLLGWRTLGVT